MMLLDHLEGTLNYCRTKVTLGVVEAINGSKNFSLREPNFFSPLQDRAVRPRISRARRRSTPSELRSNFDDKHRNEIFRGNNCHNSFRIRAERAESPCALETEKAARLVERSRRQRGNPALAISDQGVIDFSAT